MSEPIVHSHVHPVLAGCRRGPRQTFSLSFGSVGARSVSVIGNFGASVCAYSPTIPFPCLRMTACMASWTALAMELMACGELMAGGGRGRSPSRGVGSGGASRSSSSACAVSSWT